MSAKEIVCLEPPPCPFDMDASNAQTREASRSSYICCLPIVSPPTNQISSISCCSIDVDSPIRERRPPEEIARSSPSIYKVPACPRTLKPDAYTPSIVSFGPYHYDTSDNLRQMEAHKPRVLKHLVRAVARIDITYELLVDAVRQSLPQLMGCYAEFEPWQGENDYVSILVEKHNVDNSSCRTLAQQLQFSGKFCKVEEIALLVNNGVEEFARCLVKDANVDEFARLMVKGDDLSHLVARHNVRNSIRATVRNLLLSIDNSNAEELACAMLTDAVQEFAHHMVMDGLDTLARLLVRDGVFIILLLLFKARLHCSSNSLSSENLLHNVVNGFPDNDIVFSKKAEENLWPYIIRDMLLLENQIPLQVLQILLCKLLPNQFGHDVNQLEQTKRLHKLVLGFFDRRNSDPGPGGQHILELYRNCRIFRQPLCQPSTTEPPSARPSQIPAESTTFFFLNGVNIKQSDTDSFNHFSYSKRGLLWGIIGKTGKLFIPKVELNDTSECILLNLVAFEALHKDTGNEVTYFVIDMARLLRKHIHVKIMDVWYKINLSHIWTKEDVTDCFQRLVRVIPGAGPKKDKDKTQICPPARLFTVNVLLWPAIIIKFMMLLLIEDSGRLIAYVALIFAFVSWWVGYATKHPHN